MSQRMTKPTKWRVISKDFDQPGHLPNLIRVFAVCMKKAWSLSYPLNTLWRFWSDWADAQADLSLHWALMPFCRFCHALAHFVLSYGLDQRQIGSSRNDPWEQCTHTWSWKQPKCQGFWVRLASFGQLDFISDPHINFHKSLNGFQFAVGHIKLPECPCFLVRTFAVCPNCIWARHRISLVLDQLVYPPSLIRPRDYKTFFMLNSAEHEIYFAYKS